MTLDFFRLLMPLCLLVCLCSPSHAQRIPEQDPWEDMVRRTAAADPLEQQGRDYTELVFRKNKKREWDTAQLLLCRFDPQGRLLLKETNEFILDRRNEGVDTKAKRFIGSARELRYRYDEQGNTLNRVTEDLYPTGSVAALVHELMQSFGTEILEFMGRNDPKDEARFNRKVDSLVKAGIPGSRKLKDSMSAQFNDAISYQFFAPAGITRKYTYRNGEDDTLIQTVLMALPYGTDTLRTTEEHQYTFSGNGRMISKTSYKAKGVVTSGIAVPGNLKRLEWYHYNSTGQEDTLICKEGNRTATYSNYYQDGRKLESLGLLATTGVSTDTLYRAVYDYEAGKLSQLKEWHFFKGDLVEYNRKAYGRTSDGNIREILEYRGIPETNGFREVLISQHLVLYGDAEDELTREKKLKE